MRFFHTIAAAALVAVAAAQTLAVTNYPKEVQVGSSYTIDYTPNNNTPTKFVLRKGNSDDLGTLGVLTESATGGTYTWVVSKSLVNGDDYALQIFQGSQTNYIGPIQVVGSTASALPSGSASASASSAASSSASASASASASSMATSVMTVTTTTAASASASMSMSGNSTISSPTLTASSTGTSSPSSGSSGSPSNSAGAPKQTGAASSLSTSPLAFVFGAVAAMAYLN